MKCGRLNEDSVGIEAMHVEDCRCLGNEVAATWLCISSYDFPLHRSISPGSIAAPSPPSRTIRVTFLDRCGVITECESDVRGRRVDLLGAIRFGPDSKSG